jgi:endonuclease YncB( thermonuclease family)
MVLMALLKRLCLIICFFLLTLLVSIFPQNSSLASEYNAQIERIVDGDTVSLRDKKVRLVSIDAPETNYNGYGQFPGGQQAKEKLMKLLSLGTEVTIH